MLVPGSTSDAITNFTWQGGRFTDDGDFANLTAWVNSEGHWGVSSQVTNNSVWCHTYHVEVEFGHSTTADQSDFVSYFRGRSRDSRSLCGHGDVDSAIDGGSGDATVDVLRDNFSSINTAKLYVNEA